jgi:hypothetical protein
LSLAAFVAAGAAPLNRGSIVVDNDLKKKGTKVKLPILKTIWAI